MFISRRAAFEKIYKKSREHMKLIMNMYKEKYNIATTEASGYTIGGRCDYSPQDSYHIPHSGLGTELVIAVG